MNTISTISPYKDKGQWVFDDEAAGLKREALVAGTDLIMDAIAQAFPGGFTLVFSHIPFPGATEVFEWVGEENSGNWYNWTAKDMKGWLCPALLKYFETAPKRIHLQIKDLQKPNPPYIEKGF